MLLVDLGDTIIVDVKPPENPLRLVLLDVGITTSLDPADMDNLRKVFTAVIQGDVSGNHELICIFIAVAYTVIPLCIDLSLERPPLNKHRFFLH